VLVAVEGRLLGHERHELQVHLCGPLQIKLVICPTDCVVGGEASDVLQLTNAGSNGSRGVVVVVWVRCHPLGRSRSWSRFGLVGVNYCRCTQDRSTRSRRPSQLLSPKCRWRASISTVVEARTVRPRTAHPIGHSAPRVPLIIAAQNARRRAAYPAKCCSPAVRSRPHITRPPSVFGWWVTDAIIGCPVWAVMLRSTFVRGRVTACGYRVSSKNTLMTASARSLSASQMGIGI
jgi:hypothetical protein